MSALIYELERSKGDALKALVIGGTGPTGPHVIEGLTRRGYEVSMLHRGVHEIPDAPDIRHIHADPHFPETIVSALGEESFDVVVAAYGRLKAIAQAMIGRCGHLICVSGVPVYRGFVDPESSRPYGMKLSARENSAKADESDAPSKFATMVLAAERAVLELGLSGAYLASSVRYPQIYGPRNVMPWEWAVLRRIIDGRDRMILPDDGLWIISRCAARNAAEVVLRIVDNPQTANGEAYNCADEDQFTVRQWAETVAEIGGKDLEFVGIPSLLAPSALAELLPTGARAHMIVNNEKVRSELGYREVVSARSALEETVQWLLANPVTSDGYPMYLARFDYELEDRLIKSYREAVEMVRAQAPDTLQEVGHPMPHPKRASLSADDRGR